MSAKPFDRCAIMRAAHGVARVRVATVGGEYRAWLSKALAFEWRKAREARAAAVARAERKAVAEIARRESNIGLPIRSCPADAAARPRSYKIGSVTIFAGPGAHQAAIGCMAARVGGGFQRSHNLGRRAADWS
ncbi:MULTISPECIES: hypothetical protein [Methylosinus]|uniref:Uncharacterized protein n=1 Tax=Methylosinus trichosporium (strain ATCC 35070 / NCIMB 11131 / UNIQEM 75 / OB3b) TaxID=595536 RepID=A0A2D2CZ32_METT3|nr:MULTISPECIES: hypothetical protein [Methylosinus]ATQ67909.1 hypothetical protein CQW49_08430 [Methylosinus trichosporium OB3b]OBS54017.1 hypothetical protein A8B73_02885 [Methylosinus sp. 3S-1]